MSVDLSKPIEIAEDIFWIGYVVPNDPFQCHVYLVRNGEESVLIDPGSMITFPVVLEKLFQVTPLRNIKYIILHHQDPDIVGCYSTLESIFPKGERFIVTHWRTETLLKHYQVVFHQLCLTKIPEATSPIDFRSRKTTKEGGGHHERHKTLS